MTQTALVFGSTGLIGKQLVALLADDPHWTRVTCVTRRPMASKQSKVVQVIADAESLQSVASQLAADCVFCCLGTTQKIAGGREGFRRVDYDYVLQCATLARQQGARRLLLISALGASASSPNFYSRVKGEVEIAVTGLGYETVDILRPSLLLGDRAERRPVEHLFGQLIPKLSFLMNGRLKRYRPITATQVAKAMTKIARTPSNGTSIYSSDELATY